jgi:hypothetical protein
MISLLSEYSCPELKLAASIPASLIWCTWSCCHAALNFVLDNRCMADPLTKPLLGSLNSPADTCFHYWYLDQGDQRRHHNCQAFLTDCRQLVTERFPSTLLQRAHHKQEGSVYDGSRTTEWRDDAVRKQIECLCVLNVCRSLHEDLALHLNSSVWAQRQLSFQTYEPTHLSTVIIAPQHQGRTDYHCWRVSRHSLWA